MKHKVLNFFRFGLFLVIFCIPHAHALNVQLFHPLTGQPDQGVIVYGSQGLQKNQTQVGLFLNYLNDPLEFSLPPDNQVDQIVDSFLTMDALLSYGVADWFTFHFGLPFNPYSEVEPISDFESTTDASLGDLRFAATLGLYKKYDEKDATIQRSGLALIPFFTVPMHNKDDYFGESSWTGGGLLAIDHHAGKRHYFALNLGARFRETEEILNLEVGHEFIASASYVNRLSCKRRIDLVTEIQSSTTFDKFYSEEISSPTEVFIGIRKQSSTQRWEWNLGAGRGINNGYGAADIQAYTGLSYRFFNQTKPLRHCCEESPKVAAVVAPVQELGSFFIEVVDSNGKPVVLPIHIFKDDLLLVQNETNLIKRPMEAGTYRLEVVQEKPIVESFEIVSGQETYKKIIIPVAPPLQPIVRYVEPIYFDSNKDTIKIESFAALDDVYSIILEFPNIQNILIEAHTDSQGKDSYNLDLSNRRAKSAKEYLSRKGIAASQIKTMGFGEVRPIDTNETLEGRAKNRRVEFLIESPSQDIKILQRQK